MGFRPLSKSSLSCEAVGRNGVGERNPCKVDKAATSSREVKMDDRLYSFSVFTGIFSQYALKRIKQLWLHSIQLSTGMRQ